MAPYQISLCAEVIIKLILEMDRWIKELHDGTEKPWNKERLAGDQLDVRELCLFANSLIA